MQRVLVTGGTGTLGSCLVSRLLEAGCDVRVLSRGGGEGKERLKFVKGDLATGEGVEDAVREVDVIVHCAGSSTGDGEKTRNLVKAMEKVGAMEEIGGVRHLVYISVVGAERVPVKSGIDRAMFGYFAEKRASEQIVMDAGVPWTILRATQFHDLLLVVAEAMVKLPVMPSFAGFQYQPVDADEVAARLVELALGEPAGLVPEMGGPKVYRAVDLMRGYLRASGRRRWVVPVWLPGQAARAHRRGANVTPEHADGKRTWEEFLAERVR